MHRILHSLHYSGPLRRSRLSEQLDIRKNSVGSMCDELLSTGIIEQADISKPRSPLRIAKDGARILIIHADRDMIRAGVMNLAGKLSNVEPICDLLVTPEAFLEHAAAFVNKHMKGSNPPAGLGIAIPGIIDSTTGFVLRTTSVGPWSNLNLSGMLSRKINIPIIIHNDIRCLAWHHIWFDKRLASTPSMLCVGLYKGIACATILSGQLYSQGQVAAGEIGHVRSGNEDKVCYCGKRNCLELTCSIPSIKNAINSKCSNTNEIETISDIAAKANDLPVITEVLDHAAKHLAGTLAPIMAALNPVHLVISSTNLSFSELISVPLRQYLSSSLIGMDVANSELIPAGDLLDNQMRGAGALIIDQFFRNGGRYQ